MEKCLTFALTDFLAGRSGMRERCLFVSPVIRMREAAGAALLLLHLFAFPSAAFFLPPDPRILFFHFRTRTTTAAASSSFSSSAVCFAALRKIPLCVCHLLKDHPSHPNFCFAVAPERASRIKPGDILRIRKNTHSAVLIQVDGDTLTVCEGNNYGTVHWGRKISASSLAGDITYVERRYVMDSEETAATGQ